MFADNPYSVIPLALLATCLLSAGCSTRIELERTQTTEATQSETSTAESDRTTIQLDSRPRSRQPTAPNEPPPKPIAPPVTSPTNSGNTLILNFRGGDNYYHSETHVHIQQSPPPRVEERIVIHREAEPPRYDERCERLRKEHEERVRRWREFPGGY